MSTETRPFLPFVRSAPAGRRPVLRAVRRAPGRGAQEPAGDTRIELDLVIAAAVSDQGRVHRRNEDSFHLEVSGERNVAVVVCDGISSASAGNVAARDAARAAGTVLAQAVADPARDAETAILEAIQAANDAVVHVEWTTRTRRVDPSCTLVCAAVPGPRDPDRLGRRQPRLLVRRRRVPPADGRRLVRRGGSRQGRCSPPSRRPRARSCTRSPTGSGPTPPRVRPRLAALRPERPGRLVLCTDGLWNYAPGADELARLIEALPAGAAPAAVARALADTANDRGGHDNITVVVVDIDPSAA